MINNASLRLRIKTMYFEDRLHPKTIARQLGITLEEVRAAVVEDAVHRLVASPLRQGVNYPIEKVRAVLEDYVRIGSVKKVALMHGVHHNTVKRWIRPEKAVEKAAVKSTKIMEAVLDNALQALKRDDQRDAELSDVRCELAKSLYDKAEYFWIRAREKAGADPVPHQELKALVAAGHYAVKDAQLLGGQPTERVESFFKELENMSDEELRRFVGESLELPSKEEIGYHDG